jgi:uncharacterized protein involved in exopolysaccharide biosynthesis
MTNYLKTFKRHRILLLLPIALTCILAVWTVAGSPKSYEATSSLWVDTPPPEASSLIDVDPAVAPPADQHQLFLIELLKTRAFRLAVADKSPLRRHFETSTAQGWGPTDLLARIRSKAPLDARLAAALNEKRVFSTVAGPQVLQIGLRGPTPEVAAGTLRALIAEFEAQRVRLSRQRNITLLGHYRSQSQAAAKGLVAARQGVAEYRRAHPEAAASDPQLKALRRAEKSATSELTSATANVRQASTALERSGVSQSGTIVLDEPRLPTGPVHGLKTLVLAIFGGFLTGALISVLGLIALTPGRNKDLDISPDEIERLLFDVPVTVPEPDAFFFEEPVNGHGARRSGRDVR